RLLWQPGEGRLDTGVPTVREGVVYVGGAALRASDGGLLWRFRGVDDVRHIYSTPLLVQGGVLVMAFCVAGASSPIPFITNPLPSTGRMAPAIGHRPWTS